MHPRRVFRGVIPGGVLLALAFIPLAEARGQTRKLLYPKEVQGPLAKVVAKLTDPEQAPIPDKDLKPSRFYARVLDAGHVVAGPALRQDAWLGARPFVFLTVPEALYGKGLLRVFSDIGYSADQVLPGELDREMVAVVFSYPPDICPHAGKDGTLPKAWSRRVYPATWENAFALFEKLAADAAIDPNADSRGFTPEWLLMRDERERGFALNFPDSGRLRVRKTGYQFLKGIGGADWEYRWLLERKLGMSEHFTGNGRTEPAIERQKEPRLGLPEWLGPNVPVGKLKQVAVVHLGALRLSKESASARSCLRRRTRTAWEPFPPALTRSAGHLQ